MKQTSIIRRGFSLVELLAVIAIIGIMAAIIGGLAAPTDGSSLKAAQASAQSMFQAARTVASMRRTEARVIIYKDGNGVDRDAKFLRYMGVVYWDEENTEWVPANSGVYLPAGVYYMPNDGSGIVAGADVSDGDILKSEFAPSDNVSYPVKSGTADEWYYYSFDGSGSARSTEEASDTRRSFAGSTVVFASGDMGPPGADPEVTINNEFLTTGFVIRRIGGVLPVTDYDQIKTAIE